MSSHADQAVDQPDVVVVDNNVENDLSADENAGKDMCTRDRPGLAKLPRGYVIPKKKKKKTKNVSDSADSCDSSSTSASDTSSSNDTDSETESDSDSRNSKRKKKNTEPRSKASTAKADATEVDNYEMFDPLKAQQDDLTELTPDMEKYICKHFNKHVKEDAIQTSVLDDNPVPDMKALKVPELDEYMEELALHKSVKQTDKYFKRVQKKIVSIMGPLVTLWRKLHDARVATDETLDIFDILKNLEQVVLLVGQANSTTLYHRRVNALTSVLKNQKKAQKTISKHEKTLNKSKKSLFGKRFYKTLERKAKLKRKAKDLLATPTGSGSGGYPKRRKVFASQSFSVQPFRGGPSRIGHRGGQRDRRPRTSNWQGYGQNGKPRKGQTNRSSI